MEKIAPLLIVALLNCVGASNASETLSIASHGGPSGFATVRKDNAEPGQAPANSCKRIQGSMSSGSECWFPRGTLQSIYSDVFNHRRVRDSNCLLKALPRANTHVEKCENKNGLLRIEYTIGAQAVEIDMEYAGGVSTIEIVQERGGVRRKITHSAD